MELIEKFKEALVSIIPVMIIVFLLHFFLVPMDGHTLTKFIIGAVCAIFGLTIFLRGVDIGIVPLGERIGSSITKKKSLPLVIFVGFVIGTIITIAEPDVQVLAAQVFEASGGLIGKDILILSVALGVGIFVSFALARIILQFSIRKTLVIGYSLIFIMALFSPEFLPLAFDAGGVTTGSMTVPFLLSLGLGVSSVRSDKAAEEDSFGIAALSSIGPIMTCLILGVIFK